MKIISKLACIVAIAALTLTGCSATSGASQPTLSPSGEVAKTVDEFYAKSIEKAPEAVKSFDKGPTQMAELLSPEDIKILGDSEDPFTGLDSISPEGQKKVAAFYKGLDPVADFYSYEGLTESQRAGVSLTSLITTTFLTTPEVANAAREIDESDIKMIDDTHASTNFKPGIDAEKSKTEMFLIKTDSGWKIDGKKTYDQYLAEMKK
jgi:hypothetical protein